MLFGIPYELPVTPETAPIIALLEGSNKPWSVTTLRSQSTRRSLVEKGMRDIVRVLLHQVRDTIGAEVARDILQEISHKLDPMVNRRVRRDMRKALPQRLKALADGNSQKP